MHCHPKKRTSLVVLSGEAVSHTLDSQFKLRPLDGLIIDSGVFHSTKAVGPTETFLMEIETPPDKNDLVRLKDEYGREGTGYEGESAISQELKDFAYIDFHSADFEKDIGIGGQSLCNRSIRLGRHSSVDELVRLLKDSKAKLACLLDDKLCNGQAVVSEIGDIMQPGEMEFLQRQGKKAKYFHSLIIS